MTNSCLTEPEPSITDPETASGADSDEAAVSRDQDTKSEPAATSAGSNSPAGASAESPDDGLSPLRSVHTSSFADILTKLNSSLVVSTYQAGRLIMLRPDGDTLNTHFRGFNKPMGVAIAGDRMAIGTAMDIAEYHNVPAAGARADEQRPADACFLPRMSHSTGDIQIHEMEWGLGGLRAEGRGPRADDGAGPLSPQPSALGQIQPSALSQSNAGGPTAERGQVKDDARRVDEKRTVSALDLPPSALKELWFVNTRFSCLCTRSAEHSFSPQWRPSFISAYAPQDRCHLNGLGMVDGRPKYVTALGESDEPAGWRDNKKSGGILMDVPSGEIIARGLSMPHSPRFYNGQLWVLNSGEGGIGIVDPATGKYEQVAELPGFTRGLSFYGRYAFIGLSQVRESAIFSGIRIAERPEEERWSGVAVVDITTGQTVAWLRFEDAVQEVFAVGILPGRVWPDLINDDPELLGSTWVLPDEALKDVPEDWQKKPESSAEAGQ